MVTVRTVKLVHRAWRSAGSAGCVRGSVPRVRPYRVRHRFVCAHVARPYRGKSSSRVRTVRVRTGLPVRKATRLVTVELLGGTAQEGPYGVCQFVQFVIGRYSGPVARPVLGSVCAVLETVRSCGEAARISSRTMRLIDSRSARVNMAATVPNNAWIHQVCNCRCSPRVLPR
jgi:hypothetical protein